MKKIFTRDEVIQMLRSLQGEGTAADLAQNLGVTSAYICDLYKSRRDPGPRILKALGLESERKVEVIYRKVA